MDFLRECFPGIKFIILPGFRVTYPSKNTMILQMALQAPGILSGIWKEHRRLIKIIRERQIDVVISDNRFGLWSRSAYSIYLTHQVMIKAPGTLNWVEPILYKLHQWFINHYQECWVPDLPGEKNLSGDLAHLHPLPPNGSFIGALSRFMEMDQTTGYSSNMTGPDLLVMLSGPEPQRTMLEDLVMKDLAHHANKRTVILRGLPGQRELPAAVDGVTLYNHLKDDEISQLIKSSGIIICRAGYSTIMDLVALGRGAVLVPTPGQTEQQYLARYLSVKGEFQWMPQESFSIGNALQAGKNLQGAKGLEDKGDLLKKVIAAFPGRVKKSVTS
jgi:UDP-N-acetylglucosamine transferase subunit ALG13